MVVYWMLITGLWAEPGLRVAELYVDYETCWQAASIIEAVNPSRWATCDLDGVLSEDMEHPHQNEDGEDGPYAGP